MDNSERIANAEKWNRSVRIRAVFRLLWFCTLTGLLSAFLGSCIYDSFTGSFENFTGGTWTALSLLILALLSPVFFLLYYGLYKKIDNEIEAIRGAADELAAVRYAAVADPNAFVAEMKQKAVVSSWKTLLTPDMIMTYGMFHSYLPLNCIQSLIIEPHTKEKHAYLLVHAFAGEEHRQYIFECPECFGAEHFLREQAARITECFRVNAPQCQITSPYIEQLPPSGTVRQPF